MSVTNKIVNTYAKSFFQIVSELQIKNFNTTTEDFKKFKISKILSSEKQDKQKENTFSVFAMREELCAISSIMKASEKLEIFFKNPTITEQLKFKFILSIFPGLTGITVAFLKLLAEKSHLSLFPEICNEYEEILLKFQKSTKIRIISPSIFEEEYAGFLLNTLKNLTGSKEIILSFCYDPKLLGGFILEYNSISIDASMLKEFSLFFDES